MKTGILWLKTFVAASILLTFIPEAVPMEKPVVSDQESSKSQIMKKDNVTVDWQMTLKKAREEGSVVVHGGLSPDGLKNSVKLFKDKFGIDLIVTSAPGAIIVPKIMDERRHGLYLLDVFIAGQNSFIDLKLSGAFDPLEPVLALPEVRDQKFWYDEKFNWTDDGKHIFNFALRPHHTVVVNTDLVKPGEIQSYQDLLNPKWKGKIIINDPTVAGMGETGFAVVFSNHLVNQDYFRKLVSQNPIMTRDQFLQATDIAKGKYPIILWPSLMAFAKVIVAGAPVMPIEMKEGTAATSPGASISILNKAPHPNAAKVFINWFLSREGQVIHQKATRTQTRRIDVPSDDLFPFERRVPGKKYLSFAGEKETFMLNELNNYRQLCKQIFAPLK